VRSLVLLGALALTLAGVLAPSAWASPRFHDVFTCHSVTYEFTGFPEASNNVFKEKIKLDGLTPYLYTGTYTFNGPSGSNTIPVTIPAGHHELTAYAEYNTNGAKGESDYRLIGGITCAPEPALSIAKAQMISGSGGPFTTAELTAKSGQTVNYQIVVTNTGNVPLTLTNFTDARCDLGTITGGPGATPLALGKSTTYLCHHVLSAGGPYENTATVTGSPPEGQGSPVTRTSDPVIVDVVAEPAFTIEKRQEIAGSGKGFTNVELSANVGQTIDYEVIVKNSGNVPLTFTGFTDEKCDPGTFSGGPGGPVLPGGSTIYFCNHMVLEADKLAGVYSNTATVTGTPPEGFGPPATHTSNTVLVEVPVPKPRLTDTFTCHAVTYVFSGFPNRPNNTVTLKIKLDGVTQPYLYVGKFVFNGPSASVTIPITVSPGHHEITAYVEYKMNGINGESDLKLKGGITCSAEPGFTVEKLQEVAGSASGFSTGERTAAVGQTVDYEVIVKNTGNVPMTFGAFSDERCDAGTISGGPGEAALAPGASTTYLCDHVLVEADGLAGSYANSATVTGTPPEGMGGPVMLTSNTVVVGLT
jgi:hypothetical protein